MLTASDIKRLAKLGVSAEALAVVAEIFERNGGATPDATPTKTVRPKGSTPKSTERSRKWREKKKLETVAASVAQPVASVAESVALPVVSPTPPSLTLVVNPLIEEVLKEESENLVVMREPVKRGCRLPEDFVPDASCEKVARELNYTRAHWKAVLANFFDYWRGIPGARGRKLDWQATFRNDLRSPRNAPRNTKGNANGTHTIRTSLTEAFDYIDRREEGADGGGQEGGNDDPLLLPGLRQGSA